MRKTDVLESHGVRLHPESWRKIERLAATEEVDRTTWLREQVQALLSRTPDVHNTDVNGHNANAAILEFE